MIKNTIRLRRINITQWLNKNEGGVWKYGRKQGYWRDEKNRFVWKVCMNSDCDDCGRRCENFRYCLYGTGTPKWLVI